MNLFRAKHLKGGLAIRFGPRFEPLTRTRSAPGQIERMDRFKRDSKVKKTPLLRQNSLHPTLPPCYPGLSPSDSF